jgi:hypothetical protein
MKLVEPEAEGPIEGEEPVVTPPRPPHRRVSVSFLFTLTVLIGTVITIYVVFPARHNVLLTRALEHHRDPEPTWDVIAPSPGELRTWAIGVLGKNPPLPPETAKIVAAESIDILDRRAAVVRLEVGTDPVTYLVQNARGIAPKHSDRTDGDLRALAWRSGKFTVVVVGPSATATTWIAAMSAKKK